MQCLNTANFYKKSDFSSELCEHIAKFPAFGMLFFCNVRLAVLQQFRFKVHCEQIYWLLQILILYYQ